MWTDSSSGLGQQTEILLGLSSAQPTLAQSRPYNAHEYQRLFYFHIFRKHFLQKYIFNIIFYSYVPLPPGRGAAGTYM